MNTSEDNKNEAHMLGWQILPANTFISWILLRSLGTSWKKIAILNTD